MNKILKSFILSSLALSFANVKAHTQKTYLQTRPFLSNMPMEYTTWHTQINKTDPDKHSWFGKFGDWGMSFQATGFYQKSNNKGSLGKYFGYHAQTADEDRNYISVTHGGANETISSPNMIHNNLLAQNLNIDGKFFLRPTQKTVGIRLDLNHNINKFFVKLSTPITDVKTGINPDILGTPEKITAAAPANTSNAGKTIMDFFSGNFEETAVIANLQEKLKYAKIGDNHSKTTLGDIEIAFGYNPYKTKYNHVKFGIDLIIPTSKGAKGEWLFEPINGNGGHWAVGGFIDSKINLWKKDERKLGLLMALNTQYLFESDEKRTIGIKDYIGAGIQTPLAHYYLAGKNGEHSLFPAANILTQNLKVTPGFHVEGLVGFALVSKTFSLDLGYNLFYQEAESIKLKNAWLDDTYALADAHFDSSAAVAFDPATDNLNNYGPIQSTNIDLGPATTPRAITHKLYTGLGYCFNKWERPLMLGMGGSYELLSGNTALENFEFYVKAGLSF